MNIKIKPDVAYISSVSFPSKVNVEDDLRLFNKLISWLNKSDINHYAFYHGRDEKYFRSHCEAGWPRNVYDPAVIKLIQKIKPKQILKSIAKEMFKGVISYEYFFWYGHIMLFNKRDVLALRIKYPEFPLMKVKLNSQWANTKPRLPFNYLDGTTTNTVTIIDICEALEKKFYSGGKKSKNLIKNNKQLYISNKNIYIGDGISESISRFFDGYYYK